jgi:hypothetical protein
VAVAVGTYDLECLLALRAVSLGREEGRTYDLFGVGVDFGRRDLAILREEGSAGGGDAEAGVVEGYVAGGLEHAKDGVVLGGWELGCHFWRFGGGGGVGVGA